MTFPGRLVSAAISVTDSEDVLVARIDRGGRQDAVQVCKDRAFDVEALRDCLHSEVRVGEVVAGCGECDASEDGALLVFSEFAFGDGFGQGFLQVCPAAFQGGVVDFDPGDGEARTGEHFDDAGAHRAEPDHSNLVDFLHHGHHPRRGGFRCSPGLPGSREARVPMRGAAQQSTSSGDWLRSWARGVMKSW